MAKLGRREETASEINHYERLEFLGDAVVEFLTRSVSVQKSYCVRLLNERNVTVTGFV